MAHGFEASFYHHTFGWVRNCRVSAAVEMRLVSLHVAFLQGGASRRIHLCFARPRHVHEFGPAESTTMRLCLVP